MAPLLGLAPALRFKLARRYAAPKHRADGDAEIGTDLMQADVEIAHNVREVPGADAGEHDIGNRCAAEQPDK